MTKSDIVFEFDEEMSGEHRQKGIEQDFFRDEGDCELSGFDISPTR